VPWSQKLSRVSQKSSRAIKAGLELPSNFLDEFGTDAAKSLMFRMKNLFHAVGTISPLVMLVSSQWTNQKVAREHLLSVRTFWLSPVFIC
jgi:hypothetical protein